MLDHTGGLEKTNPDFAQAVTIYPFPDLVSIVLHNCWYCRGL